MTGGTSMTGGISMTGDAGIAEGTSMTRGEHPSLLKINALEDGSSRCYRLVYSTTAGLQRAPAWAASQDGFMEGRVTQCEEGT